MKKTKLSHGWSPEDIKTGDTILLIKVKGKVLTHLMLAHDYESHNEGNKAQDAKVDNIEKFGGTWMLKTSIGDISLTNNDNGYLTFVK